MLIAVVSTTCLTAENDIQYLRKVETQIINIADAVRESVVHVKVLVRKNNQKYEQFGSGFVINKAGQVFTNHHVIDKAEKITLQFYKDPKEYPAKLLGSDKSTDVALLVVDAPLKKLKPVLLSYKKDIKVGQWAIAVGNPYGFDRTVSFGIISAKGRNLPNAPVLNEFIQTDALIAPGSSGGPLLDIEGRVVGINSRATSKGGIGFTIPIGVALEVRDKILKEGTIKRGFLGLGLRAMNFELRKELGIKSGEGVLVTRVNEMSSLSGKVSPLDMLLKIKDKSVSGVEKKDITGIVRQITKLKIGSKVEFTFRNHLTNNSYKVIALIHERPPQEGISYDDDSGFSIKEITQNIYERYLLMKREGVYVSYVRHGSSAKQAGLMVGDIILSINKTLVHKAKDLKAINAKKKIATFLVQIMRGRNIQYVLINR